jgi:hypothetical protein
MYTNFLVCIEEKEDKGRQIQHPVAFFSCHFRVLLFEYFSVCVVGTFRLVTGTTIHV